MDFATDPLAERPVHDLMPCDRALALELAGHDPRGEMRVVVRSDVHPGAGEGGADQYCNLFGIHAGDITWGRCTPGPLKPRPGVPDL